VARRDYIEAVRAYNTELRTFPGRLWAATLYSDAEPMPVFAAAEGTREAPRVNFGTGGGSG
jgi:LemA protein